VGGLGLVLVRELVPQSLTFAMKPLGRRQLESVRVEATRLGKVTAMQERRVWGEKLVRIAKECLEARGRGEGGFIHLSPSLATSVAEACLFFFPFTFLAEPATCR